MVEVTKYENNPHWDRISFENSHSIWNITCNSIGEVIIECFNNEIEISPNYTNKELYEYYNKKQVVR